MHIEFYEPVRRELASNLTNTGARSAVCAKLLSEFPSSVRNTHTLYDWQTSDTPVCEITSLRPYDYVSISDCSSIIELCLLLLLLRLPIVISVEPSAKGYAQSMIYFHENDLYRALYRDFV